MVVFIVNGSDDFWGIWSGFEVFMNLMNGYVNGMVMWFQFVIGYFFQQFGMRLNFVWVFVEVQYCVEFIVWQFVLFVVWVNQGMVVDIEFLVVEFVVFYVVMFFVYGIEVYGMGEQVVCVDSQFMWVKWFSDIVVSVDFEVKDFIYFVVVVG